LLIHWVRAAAARTFWTAGTSRAIRMAMMAMTTNNSMSVKAGRGPLLRAGEWRNIIQTPMLRNILEMLALILACRWHECQEILENSCDFGSSPPKVAASEMRKGLR